MMCDMLREMVEASHIPSTVISGNKENYDSFMRNIKVALAKHCQYYRETI